MLKSVLVRSALIASCFAAAAAAAAAQGLAAPSVPVADVIAGRKVETLTLPHPTSKDVIVFEGGSRGTIDKWGAVPALLARDATVFAYNRPGYGDSDAAATPRDGRTIVEELRVLLRHKGLKPPYVLVGHSLGGLYVQLFARAYPEEVKALVLVDSLYPGMVKKTADFPWMKLQQFWSGKSFQRMDDGNLLSYDLARILVGQLARDWESFRRFVLAADAEDAGNAAAREHLGVGVGELACALLEREPSAAWSPDPASWKQD